MKEFKAIESMLPDEVKEVFERLKLKLLGPEYVSKAFIFQIKSDYDPKLTIKGAFTEAFRTNALSDNIPKDEVEILERNALNYINTLENKALSDYNRIIVNGLLDIKRLASQSDKDFRDILLSDEGQEILKKIKEELLRQSERINAAAESILNTELHTALNVGSYTGIIEASQKMGIEDPTVFKIGVLDDKRCKHCWRLWTLPDKITPRVYKLSELVSSPGDWRKPDPSIAPTHPNCRDVLTILVKGFSFDANGRVVYKGKDWDEYAHQRSIYPLT